MTAAPTPTVSVIMATYKGAAFVTDTIASVQAQTLADFELLIVDDCSPDDTLAVLAGIDDPRITVIRSEQNRGPVHSRNRAFAAARGRYVAGLDQDDLCRPTRFARQVAYLDAHRDTALVGTAAALLEDGRIRPGEVALQTTPGLLDYLLMVQNPVAWSSTMFRADAARQLLPFTRPELLYAEDFDFYHRLRRFGRIARLDDELTVYRCHAGGVSRRFKDQMDSSTAQVLAEAYAPIFGADAPACAALVTDHALALKAVPDLATIARLAAIFAAIHANFLASGPHDDTTLRLVAHEQAGLRWQMLRGAVRSGRISHASAATAWPEALPRDRRHRSDQLVSRLVGLGRRLVRPG